jgi:hypothetical protein
MAIKRVPNPEPVSEDERTTREEMMGRLAVWTLRQYDTQFVGDYGTGPRAIVDVWDVEEAHQYRGLWLHGNAGRNVGEALKPGEEGLGRLISGTSKATGRAFVGMEWAEDEGDFAAAEASRALSKA